MSNLTPEKYTIVENEKETNLPESSPFSSYKNESIDYGILNSAFRGGPQKRSGLKLTAWLLMSVVVDHLLIVFKCCIFLIVASVALKLAYQTLSMTQFLKPFLFQKNLVTTIFGLYFLVSLIYFVGFRVLLGATIGEWSCGLRVGQPYERLQSGYKLKIISRVFLIIGTGIVLLPLLSLILKKDIAGQLTKANLYTLK